MIFFKFRALTFFLLLLTQLLVFGCNNGDNGNKNVTIEKSIKKIDLPCKLNDTIYKGLTYGISEKDFKNALKDLRFHTLVVDRDSFYFSQEAFFYKNKLCGLGLEYYNFDTIIDQNNNYLIQDTLITFLKLEHGSQRMIEIDTKMYKQRKYRAKKNESIPIKLQKIMNLYVLKYGQPVFDDTLYRIINKNYVSGGDYLWKCNDYSIKITFVVTRETESAIFTNESETSESETYNLLDQFKILYYYDKNYEKLGQQINEDFKRIQKAKEQENMGQIKLKQEEKEKRINMEKKSI